MPFFEMSPAMRRLHLGMLQDQAKRQHAEARRQARVRRPGYLYLDEVADPLQPPGDAQHASAAGEPTPSGPATLQTAADWRKGITQKVLHAARAGELSTYCADTGLAVQPGQATGETLVSVEDLSRWLGRGAAFAPKLALEHPSPQVEILSATNPTPVAPCPPLAQKALTQQRQAARLKAFRRLGGDLQRVSKDRWHCRGRRGALAQLVRDIAARAEPYRDRKHITLDLQAAAEAEWEAPGRP